MIFSDTPATLAALWALWLAQAAWGCWNVGTFASRARRLATRASRRGRREGPYSPRAAVVVPVKGGGPQLAGHAAALGRQDYPDYRLIFVVESQDDPACATLQPLLASLGRPATLLVAGRASHGGQKVHNQLHALANLQPRDEVVVFADADAVPHTRWLASLVEPLRRPSVGASTGYRWLVPSGGQARPLNSDPQSPIPDPQPPIPDPPPPIPALHPSCFASAINGSVACLLGPPRRNHAWGGSMAITREMIGESKLVEHWQGALSDDYQLTRAVKAAGKIIHFVPDCLVLSPVRYTWGGLWEFGRRQYTITRVHEPWVWLIGLAITLLYTAGWVAAAAAACAGIYAGLAAWAGVAVLDFFRANLRRRAVRQLLGDAPARALRPVWRLERWATPLWMGLHLLLIAGTACKRRIRWAGIAYRLQSRQDVRIET